MWVKPFLELVRRRQFWPVAAAVIGVLCLGLTVNEIASQNALKQAVLQLKTATDLGTNSVEFQRLLIAAQAKRNQSTIFQYDEALRLYRQSSELWALAIQNSGQICDHQLPVGQLRQILQAGGDYQLPASGMVGCIEIQPVLKSLWRQASKQL